MTTFKKIIAGAQAILADERKVVLALLCCFAVLLAYLSYYNTMWEGGADNFWHYYFSRYSYQYPKYLLHHWGKPIFTLLSAPFSQFGFYGLNIFNILCGLTSAYVTYLFCKKLNFKNSWLVIFVLLLAPLYFFIIQSAMTEPLFSLLLVLSAYLFFSKKYIVAAVVASFLMYSRTEGTFILLIFAAFLIFEKRWYVLPLLGTAMLIYSFAGLFSGHDFLWFFTENPYSAVSPYGHGDYLHFLRRMEYILGIPEAVLLVIGTGIFLYQLFTNNFSLGNKSHTAEWRVAFLVLLPAVLFTSFHVYAWAEGKFASGGIERVFSCVFPLTSILIMYAVEKISAINSVLIRYVTITVVMICLVGGAFAKMRYPTMAYGADRLYMEEVADWFKKERKPGSVIYYSHPAFIFYCDYNPFDKDNRECFGFPNDCSGKEGETFYYVWDSMFSQFACGNSLEDLEKCSNLKKIKDLNNYDHHVVFFESK
jgi:hypothetical protein